MTSDEPQADLPGAGPGGHARAPPLRERARHIAGETGLRRLSPIGAAGASDCGITGFCRRAMTQPPDVRACSSPGATGTARPTTALIEAVHAELRGLARGYLKRERPRPFDWLRRVLVHDWTDIATYGIYEWARQTTWVLPDNRGEQRRHIQVGMSDGERIALPARPVIPWILLVKASPWRRADGTGGAGAGAVAKVRSGRACNPHSEGAAHTVATMPRTGVDVMALPAAAVMEPCGWHPGQPIRTRERGSERAED